MKSILFIIVFQLFFSSIYCQKFKIETTEGYVMIKTLKFSPLTTNGLIGPVKDSGQIVFDKKSMTIGHTDKSGKENKYYIQKLISSNDSNNCFNLTAEVIYSTTGITEKGFLHLFLYNQKYVNENVDVLIFESEKLIQIIRGNKAELISNE
jgi:hypothetical protein